jgi:UDP-N-acetylglucosamine/UDP-N-acetylgalactosamine diphosphorylase
MTSPVNSGATAAFLAEHSCFGLDPADVLLCVQGTVPAVDFRGRALLADKARLALAPNGHGGCFQALRDGGALEDMQRRGIEDISYWQVDNPLVQPFDPLFLGLHRESGSEMSSRALVKRDPFEKLGCYCLRSGRLGIMEYSDLPPELATMRDADGKLCLRAGSPAIHLLTRAFVERVLAADSGLPMHAARKKVPFLDESGTLVTPAEPNAIKFEMFIFDALGMAERPLVLEVERSEQFAPLKNATGTDSVATCQVAMAARARRWLHAAGLEPECKGADTKRDGDAPAVELSPRRFLDRQDVLDAAAELACRPEMEGYYE